MAESNATQVILTDDGLKIIKAQNTADNAASGVTNLNDPNLMSVIEKQYNISQFAGLTSQYNIIVQSARDDGIDTTAVTVAYNNLNTFMAGVLADPDHASDVDRVTYKKYQDAYNEELANIQNALQNNANNKFTSAASALSQAASTANIAKSAADSAYAYASSEIAVQSNATAKAQSTADNAFSQAQTVFSQANSEIAVNSTATAKAQSTADNAFSQAQAVGSQTSAEINSNSTATAKAQSTADNAFSQATTAIDNGKVTSQAVTALKDGSTMTIAELQNGLATKVANSDYASYKDQTASQIGEMVTNGAFSAYQQTTAGLIAQKVATSDFTAYQATTAKAIESKVESKDFNTYKTQTDRLIDDKVSTSEYASDKTQTASQIANMVSNSAFSTYQDQTASQISQLVTSGAFSAYSQATAELISDKVATSDFTAYQATTAKSIDSKVESKDFNSYKEQTDKAITSKVSNSEYASDKEQTASEVANMVSNSAFSTYQDQTASQIGEMVTNGAFSAYKQTTAGLISDKVSTSAFSAYQATTASAIDSKVESKDFNSYKEQTDRALEDTVSSAQYTTDKKQTDSAIESKVSTIDFNNLKISNRNLALGTATAFKMAGNGGENNASLMYSTSHTIPNGTTITASFDVTSTSSSGSYLFQFINSTWQSFTGSQLTSGTQHVSVTFTTSGDFSDGIQIRLDNSTSTVTVSNFIISESSKEVSWTPAPEDQATESQFTQLKDNIDLRVKKGDLISDINTQAGNILISASHQLILSSNTIYFDTDNPVIIPSANIDTALINKTLKAADISANTFTTNNGTFTVDQNGAITAKNMTLIGGTLTSPTINASTINGATLNMQTDGLINSPYTGIQQSADQFYHPWKLNTGQLTIGQGYITSVSSGTRSINGVPKQFNNLQGTLSASYLKFTNDYGARTYIDADMFTYSNQTNDTAMVTIDADGIGINMGTVNAPALTISNGYIDASSSSSYGIFGAITLGYSAHVINSDSSLFFESGHGSGNPGINIWAKGFQSMSSRLSTKRQVRLLDNEHSNSLLLGADIATFQYNQDTNADNSNEGVIIDDVNTVKQYNLPDELITRDGKAPTDLMSFIARIISQNKYQARLIEDLQIRLRKVEIKNE